MNFVPRERLALIDQWNLAPILLTREQLERLEQIGRTPPDIYGNGSQFHETPCGVVSQSGERFDMAVVSLQRHAPFEEWRECRLASEIQDIYPSPFALPVKVRIATTKAEEMRMGFAPTLVQTSARKLLIFNGSQNFYDGADCAARDIALAHKPIDWNHMPEIYFVPKEKITYFIADQGCQAGE